MVRTPGEFQVFVKPAGPACNLDCSYCYYPDKKDLFTGSGNLMMTDDILEKYIKQHIDAATDECITFSWHGGEPLLAGIGFYMKVLDIQKRFRPEGKEILNGVQTNGTLVDDQWCRFLSEEGFSIGISIDGPEHLHDINRRTKDGQGTFQKVIKGLTLMQMYGLNPEILCVVSATNSYYPLEIYRYFREIGAEYLTFLPLVVPDIASPMGVSRNSVSPLDFGYFLSAIFDEWVENDVGKIKVQIFEEAARVAFKLEHTLCILKPECGGVPVVEHNGDFFACDHYVNDTYRYGNIDSHSLKYLLACENQTAFGKAKRLTLPGYCIECEVRGMCNGECPRNRIALTPAGEPGLNYLCEGYKYFFRHCRPFVDAIAAEWRNQQGE